MKQVISATVLTVASVIICGFPARASDDIFNAFTEPGDTALIAKSGDKTLCYDSTDTIEKAAKAASINDNYGFEQAVQGHAVVLRAGTHVLLLGNSGAWNGRDYGDVQFRITSGQYAGTACWVPGFQKNLVNSIRKPN